MKITENTFFHNNNLDVLKTMESESMKLIYMDPPFNANATFEGELKPKAIKELKAYFKYKKIEWKEEYKSPKFTDVWRKSDVDPYAEFEIATKNEELSNFLNMIESTSHESHFSYLTFMAVRLIECKRVLKEDGALFYHCDHSMAHYIKLMLDIIFGNNNFKNDIIWHYPNKWSNSGSTVLPNSYDNILFYTKSNKFKVNKKIKEKTEAYKELLKRGYTTNRYNTSNGYVRNLVVYNGHFENKSNILKWIKEMKNASGDTFDNVVYKNPEGKDISAMWSLNKLHTRDEKEKLGYPTQKPLSLLQRIIEISTKEGDFVLDPFCGCATTCVAAQKLNRKWVGIDINEVAIGLVNYRIDKEIYGWKSSTADNKPGVRASDKGSFGTMRLDFGDVPIINSTSINKVVAQDQESHIYICQEKRGGVLYSEKKIGKADILADRLKSLNGTLSPTEYVFTSAWKVKDGLSVEGKLHEIFKTRRQIGEWFQDDANEIPGMIENIIILMGGEKVEL